ncbi:MAG: hypothetical protein ACRBCS_12620 [Cellvibrionaceae bacterium]
MEKSAITFIINGNTYNLRVSDTEAIRKMQPLDRQELIKLLNAVKHEDELALAAVEQRINKARASQQSATSIPTSAKTRHASTTPASTKTVSSGQTLGEKTRRLGEGDVDNIMAKLMLEEKRAQKPIPTKNTLYKWIGISIIVIVLLFIIF